MEIERDVAVELVHEENDPKGNSRASFSSGPRSGSLFPTYSDAELKKLGPVGDQIRDLFPDALGGSEKQAQALSPHNLSGKPFGSPLPQKRFGF